MIFYLLLTCIFIGFVFTPIMNLYFDTYFNTNYTGNKRKVRFAKNNEVAYYYLSKKERYDKKKAYRKISENAYKYMINN